MQLPETARALVESAAHAHMVTLNRDGSPQLTVVWAGMDGEEIVTAHLYELQKVRNLRRDGRVVLSFEGRGRNTLGLTEYLVVYGRARIEAGGAPELLQRLAHVYLGPEVVFPRTANPPAGFIARITVERVGGVGPWMEGG
jgi:PPOX class probable F420-dependent enzyme